MSKPRTATPRLSPVSSAEVTPLLFAREGVFLYADFRSFLDFSQWEAAIADAPVRLLSELVVNAEVLRGLERVSTAPPMRAR